MSSETPRSPCPARTPRGTAVLAPLATGLLGASLLGVAPASAQAPAAIEAPEVRFHLGGEELLPIAYPERYARADELRRDVEWVDKNSEDLREWWSEEGPVYLRRVTDLAGLAWPYPAVDVYLVRFWPVVSIERPLVVALDAIRSIDGVIDLPEDDDLRVLLVAHQVVHYLLDDPVFLPRAARDPVYGHPLLEPGDFGLEAMVNWLTYEALRSVWGAERLRRATAGDLWRAYNPNHAFVTEELMERWSLSRMRTLREWLVAHPEGSEIFDVAARYRERAVGARRAAATPEVAREGVTGTEYGADLGATHTGEVIVAYVDRGSPAARVGLERGEALVTIEGRAVEDVVEAQRRMDESWRRNGEINLSVTRGGREVFLIIRD